MKIYLIGMPGSGKTTIGEKLAETLSVPFIDLDAEIEKREQKSVSEIFSSLGEPHFRAAEAAILREFAASRNSFVMATGGGTPCHHQGIDVINDSGLSIFLDVSTAQLAERLTTTSNRPMLRESENLEDRLKNIRESRIATYQRAHYLVKNPTLETVLAVLP